MVTFIILNGFAVLANIVVGSYVLYINPKAKLNRLYALFAWTMAVWNLGDFLVEISVTPSTALIVNIISTLGSVWTPAFLQNFFLVFTKRKFVDSKVKVALLYSPAAIFSVATLVAPSLVTDLAVPKPWGYSLVPNVLYPALLVYIVAYLLIGSELCREYMRGSAKPDEKRQARLFLTAVVFPLLIGLITDFIVPALGIEVMPPLAGSLSTVLAVSVAYVVVTQGFLTITPGMAAVKIVETMAGALFVVDDRNQVTLTNPAAEKLLGRSAAEIVGRPIESFLIGTASLVVMGRRSGGRNSAEAQILTARGIVPVEVSVGEIRRPAGAGSVLICHDISQFKRQLAVIDDQRRRMTAILQGIGDGVFVVDNESKIITVNPAALRMCLRDEKEDLTGKNFSDVFRFVSGNDAQPLEDFVVEAMSSGTVTHAPLKTELVDTSGGRMPVAVSAAPLIGPTGVFGSVAIIRDERREREVDDLKSEFISITSHQMKTPLTAIRWLMETILSDTTDSLADSQKESLSAALQSTMRMLGLVNDLLSVSRLEDGRMAVVPAPTDMDALCASVLGEIRTEALDRNMTLRNEVHGLGVINVDARLIRRALTNLFANAVKYGKRGGEITVTGAHRAEDVVVTVSDNGVGIPAEQQPMVFTRFFHADNATMIGEQGSGLGLYLAKAVIELSGGHMWFESVENEGSSFTFSLPLSGSRPKSGDRAFD